MKKKYVILLLLVGVFLFYKCVNFLAPGSFPYAEQYEIETTEILLKNVINEFKNLNPQYSVPDNLGLNDGRNNENDLWYSVYFFDVESNQILFTWIREDKYSSTTTFALVAIMENDGKFNWKRINDDYYFWENRNKKLWFENHIYTPIIDLLNISLHSVS